MRARRGKPSTPTVLALGALQGEVVVLLLYAAFAPHYPVWDDSVGVLLVLWGSGLLPLGTMLLATRLPPRAVPLESLVPVALGVYGASFVGAPMYWTFGEMRWGPINAGSAAVGFGLALLAVAGAAWAVAVLGSPAEGVGTRSKQSARRRLVWCAPVVFVALVEAVLISSGAATRPWEAAMVSWPLVAVGFVVLAVALDHVRRGLAAGERPLRMRESVEATLLLGLSFAFVVAAFVNAGPSLGSLG